MEWFGGVCGRGVFSYPVVIIFQTAKLWLGSDLRISMKEVWNQEALSRCVEQPSYKPRETSKTFRVLKTPIFVVVHLRFVIPLS